MLPRGRPKVAHFPRFNTQVKKEIAHLAPVHNIGALSLETAPPKYSLRSEAAAWKAQYAQNLHEQAKAQLDTTCTWMRDTNRNLKREVKDLDDVRSAPRLPPAPPIHLCPAPPTPAAPSACNLLFTSFTPPPPAPPVPPHLYDGSFCLPPPLHLL